MNTAHETDGTPCGGSGSEERGAARSGGSGLWGWGEEGTKQTWHGDGYCMIELKAHIQQPISGAFWECPQGPRLRYVTGRRRKGVI